MKIKTMVILLLVFLIFSVFMGRSTLIPEDAIRFRVIANSNSEEDQFIKKQVSSVLEQSISLRLSGVQEKEEAKIILENALPEFEDLVAKTLALNNVGTDFRIHYGTNYFPEKIYNGVTYKEGEYESLVVTLGDGLGDNWWCVLFPPVCLMEAEESESEEVEYHFFLGEFFQKLFS